MEGVRVTTEGEGADRAVRVATARLAVRIDVARLVVALDDPESGVQVAELAPEITLESGPLEPGGNRVVGVGEVRGLAGDAVRVEIQAFGAGRPGLRFAVEVGPERTGLAVALALENRTPTPLRLRRLAPAVLRLAEGEANHRTRASSSEIPAPVRGLADCVPTRVADGEGFALVGFTTAYSVSPRVARREAASDTETPLEALGVESEEAYVLSPGDALEMDRVWIEIGTASEALVLEWVRRLGLEMEARAPAHPLWGVRVPLPSESGPELDLDAIAAWARERGSPGLALLTPSEGALPLGSLASDPAVQRRLAGIAPKLTDAGLRPGLRVGLDEDTAPETERAARALAKLSFAALELDGARCTRAALERVRQGAGPEAWLIASPNPAAPTAGVLDVLTIRPASSNTAPGRRVGSRIEAVLDHALLGQRLWRLAVELDPADARGSRALWRTQLTLAALAADVLLLRSESLFKLPSDWREDLERALPPLGRPRLPLAPDAVPGVRGLAIPLLGERRAVLLVNPGETPVSVAPLLATLGATGPRHVFDFWEAAYLGVAEQRLPERRVAPGHCAVLTLTPVADTPQLVGSTVHIGMGTLELASIRPMVPDRLAVSLRLAGHHSGTVWVTPGARTPARSARVDFENATTLELQMERTSEPL